MNKRVMQILEDGHWLDVATRARTEDGMTRVYRRMCRENPKGPPYGMRIITVHFEHLGWFSSGQSLAAVRQQDECKCGLRERLVGDGCDVCNPELAAELRGEKEEA
jgi:hypothetical protein